jgi:syntaxin 1B/2/3
MEMQNNPQNSYQTGLPSNPGANRPGGQPQYGQEGDVEGQYGAAPAAGTDNILDECSAIDYAITDLESRLQAFKSLQARILSDRAQVQELDNASADILGAYRNLAARMKKIKSKPESGSPRNAPQVGRIDRRLKSSLTEFQRIESEFRAQMREQQARQYRIVNPAATEDEVREAVDDPSVQVFQQALINADRRGQSQSALSAVRTRHAAIQRVEQTMMELAELFQDLDTLVQQQEVQVQEIEEKGNDVQQNIVQANQQLDTGIKSARNARRLKWIVFWIIVLVIVIIIAVVVVYFLVIKKEANTATNAVTNG